MAVRNKGMNGGALAMGRQSHGVIDVAPWANATPKPWAPDPVNDLYARKFLGLAARNKIPVYCLLMPVAPAMREKQEKNGMDRRHLAWLRRLQERFDNLYVLDWRHSNYPDPVFTDALHLDVDGAASITASLGDHLCRCLR